MIHVIATIELKPGTRAAFLAEFKALEPQVKAEDGCIEYTPAVDVPTPIAVQIPPRPDVVTVVEKWADLPALQAHLQAPHMAGYRDRVKEYVTRVQLAILESA